MSFCVSVHKAAIKAAYCLFEMKQNRVNESWEKKMNQEDYRWEHEEECNGFCFLDGRAIVVQS